MSDITTKNNGIFLCIFSLKRKRVQGCVNEREGDETHLFIFILTVYASRESV